MHDHQPTCNLPHKFEKKKKKKKKYYSIVQNYDLQKKKVPENLSNNNLKFSPICERAKEDQR